MDNQILTDLYRMGSAATDAGVLDWLRALVFSGAFLAILRSTLGRSLAAMLALLALTHAAVAQPAGPSDDEVERRLHFLESKLAAEQSQARWYEAGWSMVYVGGVGYGAYQLGTAADEKAAMADGIVGISKSLVGAGTLVLNPLEAGHSLRALRECSCADDAQRLAFAESLLRRNEKESDLRYAWQPHVISLALNAVGEVQLWTLPWGAKRHAREYRREFGGFAF